MAPERLGMLMQDALLWIVRVEVVSRGGMRPDAGLRKLSRYNQRVAGGCGRILPVGA